MDWLRTTLALGLLGSAALAGDDDSARREQIVKSMLTAMGKLTKTLSGVKDEETARSSRGELKKAADEWLSLRRRAEGVAPPSTKESEKLAKEYRAKLDEAQKLLFAQIARVQQIPGGKEALTDLAKAFARKEKEPDR